MSPQGPADGQEQRRQGLPGQVLGERVAHEEVDAEVGSGCIQESECDRQRAVQTRVRRDAKDTASSDSESGGERDSGTDIRRYSKDTTRERRDKIEGHVAEQDVWILDAWSDRVTRDRQAVGGLPGVE